MAEKTPSMKVKKGDTVLVLSGKDKGAKGRVIAAYPKDQKVLVEGVGRVKKHTRISSTQRGAQQGGIVTQEARIHVSNVMVIDSEDKPTRRSEEHTSELQSRQYLVCRLLLEKKTIGSNSSELSTAHS